MKQRRAVELKATSQLTSGGASLSPWSCSRIPAQLSRQFVELDLDAEIARVLQIRF